MRLSPGVHKENYRGYNIYFRNGGLRIGETGEERYSSLSAARRAIDAHVEAEKQRLLADHQAKIKSGQYIVARRESDGSVTFWIGDNEVRRAPTIQAARAMVFKLEAEFDKDILWA